ncbi:MAG: MFS transporter, partial [Clostridiales bacterium]
LKTLGWGGIVAGLTTLAIGLVDIFWLYLLIMVITGFSVPFCNSPLMVLVQEKVEPDIQGRVFSLVQITATLIMPLGMAIFGPLADVIPIQWLMIGSGIALIFLTTIVFKWKSFYAEGLNTTAIPASDMP